jgi:hypothetical protein
MRPGATGLERLQPVGPTPLRLLRRAHARHAHGEGPGALPLSLEGAGLGCTGSGSFLDTYEEQIVTDLAAFALPDDWKETILAEPTRSDEGADAEHRRQQLRARLERLIELYGWGHVERDRYLSERTTIEQELARRAPVERHDGRLEALAAYVESLPAAWPDAAQEQRDQLAAILHEDVWVSGPVVESVRPRPDLLGPPRGRPAT